MVCEFAISVYVKFQIWYVNFRVNSVFKMLKLALFNVKFQEGEI